MSRTYLRKCIELKVVQQIKPIGAMESFKKNPLQPMYRGTFNNPQFFVIKKSHL